MSRVLTVLLSVLGLAVVGLGAPAQAGPTGSPLTLQSAADLHGYDAVTTADGTTYVGWISALNFADRTVHLCVLPAGATACSGGMQSANAIEGSSARDLHVVDNGGTVQLVWIADPIGGSGDFASDFGVASVSGGTLQATQTVTGAPHYGSLDAVIARGGTLRATVVGSVDNHVVYYYDGLSSTPATLTRPYYVGNAQLADNGTRTVITTGKYGSLGERVSVASKPSTSSTWGSFSTVAHSYTSGDLERLQTLSGGTIRLVGMSDKALYTPYSWTWSSTSFGDPTATGDKREISTVDLAADGSGRLVSAARTASGIVVGNYGTGKTAASFLVPIGSGQTYAGGIAQVSTATSGRGWLVYSYQTDNATGQFLVARPIAVSALTSTVHASGAHGSVTLTGPRSCLPETTVKVGVAGSPARGWSIASRSLTLGGSKVGSSIDGADLAGSTHYTLKGTVVFRNGSARSTVDVALPFTTCAHP